MHATPSVSTAPGKLIGRGLTSEVFAWGDGRVLKLYWAVMPHAKVEREYSTTRAVHAAGLPVPAAYEMLNTDGRWGIVFQRIEGVSLLKQVSAKPWTLFAAARLLAELHGFLHSTAAPPELPSQKNQVESWIAAASEWTDEEKQTARQRLALMPGGESLCHGDFHPENILMSTGGPVIIDWSTGTRGNPLGDVARTSSLFRRASLPTETPWHILILFKFSREMLHQAYLRRYLQLRPGTREQIEAWRIPQGAAEAAWRSHKVL